MSEVRATTMATGQDPVRLHMQAVNSLERCKHMLLAREPMYAYALDDLAAAHKAIDALAALAALKANEIH